MGRLSRFDLSRIIKEYKSDNFFETGTFWGDGVAYALQSPFKKVYSVEIIGEIVDKARKRFEGNNKVEILHNDSISALEQMSSQIKGNTVFWLDAHFPGADAGLTPYDSENNEEFRLPLERELEVIAAARKKYHDVLILDDLRIYEDGPYQNGNVPADALPKGNRSLDFVYRCFGKTHYVFKSYLDEGYILLFPKGKYNSNHFRLKDIFKKKPVTEDHYTTGE